MSGPSFKYHDLSALAKPKLKQRLKPLVEAGAVLTMEEVKYTMESGSPTGRMYYVPGTRTKYRASSPGEAPAVRTTVYRDSWKNSPGMVSGNRVYALAFSTLRVGKKDPKFLGAVLENGDQDGRIKPRPHIAPALRTVRPKVRALVRKAAQ